MRMLGLPGHFCRGYRALSTDRLARARRALSTAAAAGLPRDPLLQPFTLKHLTLRNRILSTSHAPNYVEDRLPQRRYRKYHGEKARGGLALSMFGAHPPVRLMVALGIPASHA